jgi:hypothetical protein
VRGNVLVGRGSAPAELRDPDTPEEVVVSTSARAPETDPTLGIQVRAPSEGTPTHRLVTLGDSLTQGFQSGAIFKTDISYPALIAHELGLSAEAFRFPRFDGFGGIGLNIEALVRELEERYGPVVAWHELPLALEQARTFLRQNEDYWERGEGAEVPRSGSINHNLAVFGWDLRDVLERTFDVCYAEMQPPKRQFVPNVENGNDQAALRTLPSGDAHLRGLTGPTAAGGLGAAGTVEVPGVGDGIETLIVFVGANNALSSVTHFDVRWSRDGYDDLKRKDAFNVWCPSHFATEFDLVAAAVESIRARHVVWATVPHVTVIPLAHGVGTEKQRPGSRYFPFYTWPWVQDESFHPRSDPHLTHQRARAIDSAIDMYNDHICDKVAAARRSGRDWLVLDLAGVLDRLAYRRYMHDPSARPDWWTPYELPAEVDRLGLDSRFFESDASGILQGGLFALDGVHPTTVGYGIVAQEFMNVMHLAGVEFPQVDDSNPRSGAPRMDWERIIGLDTLVSSPPASLAHDLHLVAGIDESLEVLQRLFRRGPRSS